MVKTRVQELATELGVPTDQLMGLLKDMHVFARGPQSALEDDQVAAVRVRWEREKRKRSAEPEKKPARRRTTKAAADPAAAAEPAGRPAKRRRT
ncbi:MAG: translation initiation factor IF-2 N-terminal domain-containing protein, partial [Gemmatimonadales bacterium]